MKNTLTWQETLANIPNIPVPIIIDSEPLADGKWLQTSKKMIRYPNGLEKPWEAVSRPQEVISILSQTREKVLIIVAEYRPLTGRWNISLPAGLVDAGYTREQTCIKELQEETGYIGQIENLQYLITTPSSSGMTDEKTHQYYVSDVVPDSHGQYLGPTEFIEVLRVPPCEFASLMEVPQKDPKMFLIDSKLTNAMYYAGIISGR